MLSFEMEVGELCQGSGTSTAFHCTQLGGEGLAKRRRRRGAREEARLASSIHRSPFIIPHSSPKAVGVTPRKRQRGRKVAFPTPCKMGTIPKKTDFASHLAENNIWRHHVNLQSSCPVCHDSAHEMRWQPPPAWTFALQLKKDGLNAPGRSSGHIVPRGTLVPPQRGPLFQGNTRSKTPSYPCIAIGRPPAALSCCFDRAGLE